MANRVYVENFQNGPGGWIGWHPRMQLDIVDGVAISHGPWWVDYNHPPPEGAYLHLLYVLHTKWGPDFPEQYKRTGGPNRFVDGGFPTDFTNAKVTARLKGELAAKGADLRLHIPTDIDDTRVNLQLIAQPFKVTPDWSEQTITLIPDPAQWQDLYARHDRRDFYGWGKPIADVLTDINCDIIFVLAPLDVVPAEPIDASPHFLRADEDYPADRSRLPEGFVMLDEVRIEFSTE